MKFEKRFWSKVAMAGPEDCWIWMRYRMPNGYGSTHDANYKRKYAHRMAWVLGNGPIPAGMFVLHRCDNRPCCNPGHLFLGTAQDNTDDMIHKGRLVVGLRPTGEMVNTAKLTRDQVDRIRAAYVPGRFVISSLAREYGISYAGMHKVVTGKHWR